MRRSHGPRIPATVRKTSSLLSSGTLPFRCAPYTPAAGPLLLHSSPIFRSSSHWRAAQSRSRVPKRRDRRPRRRQVVSLRGRHLHKQPLDIQKELGTAPEWKRSLRPEGPIRPKYPSDGEEFAAGRGWLVG